MKFKLWLNKFQKFEELFCIMPDGEPWITCRESGHLIFGLFEGEYKLLQSTGLFDSKGQEIFEGDIVAEEKDYDKDDIYGDEETYTKNSIVRKGDGYFYHDEDNPHFLIMNPRYVEVVGNMYENPELVDPNDLV
jgi:uncharacterized phage protein (TIGR01671 family)